MIFIDADYLIGLYFKEDSHHQKCLKLAEKLDTEELITSWDVIDEVTTKLAYYVNKKTALKFIRDININNSKILIVFPTAKLFLKAEKILEKQTKTHVSLTDCMNMAIADEKGIRKFLSFDKIYQKNNFQLI